ncbi:phage tail tube protein [Jiella avicenniae]|uniref:Phage tail tube protein n=1 Tax=Jiella avicenniae TaxID=2907202 RepID=A0A9X1P391_9HYPH|nr:phage tail tube protein [Jiella avicenniae]MCE7028476.1 phage tail tube protein [Jiella avicenniae]
MAYQTARQIEVAYAPQTTIGTKPDAGTSKGFRANTGGLNLTKSPIESGENRRDGMTTRGRHGTRSVTGSYTGDISVGTFDDLVEAVFWGAFDTPLALTGLSLTADSSAKTITRASGSWITDGVRVGDVVRFTGFTTTANNSRNFRVVGLTATVITVAEAPTTVASAESSISMARSKKVIQGTTRRAFCIEEREIDIDGSEVFDWCRASSMAVNLQPNGMGTLQFNFVGRNMEVLEDAESPYFTSPVYTTTQGLTAVEAKIVLGATEVVDLTSLTLNFDRRAAGQPVVGSDLTPDVFDNTAQMTGSITGLRQDFTRTQAFLNETDLSLHLLFAENEAEPADFVSFVVPYLTLSSSSKSELGQDGPRTQTLDLMIGADPRGGAYDPAMMIFQSSAA